MQSNYYLVEKIIAKKKTGKAIKYLVKWVGFSLEQSTWEPVEHLENVRGLVDEFERSHKENLNMDFNPNKKIKKLSTKEPNDSDVSVSESSDFKPKSKNDSESSVSNGLSVKSSNKSSPKKELRKHKKKKIEELSNKSENAESDDSNLIVDLENDEPNQIIDSRMDSKKKLVCMVEWKVRSDGMRPDNSYITTEWLKEKYPRFLIDYYESRIKFVK